MNEGSLSLFSSSVSHNRSGNGDSGASGGEGGYGGGIFSNGQLTLTACTIANNRSGNGREGYSGGDGGGIYSSGLLALTGCTLANSAAGDIGFGSGGYGGGIYSVGHLSLTACTLASNTSGNVSNGIPTSSVGSGGGIAKCDQTRYRLTACTLAGNRMGTGAVFDRGAGIFGGRPILQHCLMADNKLTNGTTVEDVQADVITFEGSNLLGAAAIGTTTGPAPIINANPLLAPLGDYGGPTQTLLPLPGSLAIDAATGSTRTRDQRGFPIIGTADIGAVEAQADLIGFTDADNDGMDDRLEVFYGYSVGVADGRTLDSDGDGSNNAEELGNMTSPRDSTSLLKILSFQRIDAGNVTLTWTSFPGLSYTAQYSFDDLSLT